MPVGWSPVFLGAERVIGAVVGWPWARLVMGSGSLSSGAHCRPGAGPALTSELPSDPPDRKVFKGFLNHLLKSSNGLWSDVEYRRRVCRV